MVGRSAKLAGVLGKLAPILLERAMASRMRKRVYDQDKKERPHTGSLYQPMKEGRELRGGWLDEEGNVREPGEKKRGHVSTVATVIGSLAIVGFALSRRRQMLEKHVA